MVTAFKKKQTKQNKQTNEQMNKRLQDHSGDLGLFRFSCFLLDIDICREDAKKIIWHHLF